MRKAEKVRSLGLLQKMKQIVSYINNNSDDKKYIFEQLMEIQDKT